jgi:Ni/Co efflux regulator RcnB
MMKRLIAAVCFMLAAAPMALAQDKSKDTDKKAPMAAEKSTKSDAAKAKGDDKKADAGTEKSAKGDKPKKERSEKQKAQDAKMKDCNKEARDKKMKGDERSKFLSSCMGGSASDKGEKKSGK